ncbi:MAG: outer membrane protein, partial [Stellaceae bacterium]
MAADLGPPPPPPTCVPRGSVPPGVAPNAPFCAEEFSGWYLRGDIGMTNQQVHKITNVLDGTATSVNTVQKGFDSSMLFGVGLGYQWNNWLRTDLTGEYRSNANFHGLQIVNSGGLFTDEYRASKSEWLFLANAYVDLGTWWNITPFIGAGAGMSYNRISNFLDVNTPNAGVAFAPDTGKWSFAWALHAGLAYRITDSLTMELAYRYLDLGDAQSGDIATFTGVNNVVNPEKFHHITSNDVKLGLRWAIGGESLAEPLYPP